MLKRDLLRKGLLQELSLEDKSYACISGTSCYTCTYICEAMYATSLWMPISRKFDNSLPFSAIPVPMIYMCALVRPRAYMRAHTKLTFACRPIPLRLNHRLQTLIVPPSRLINEMYGPNSATANAGSSTTWRFALSLCNRTFLRLIISERWIYLNSSRVDRWANNGEYMRDMWYLIAVGVRKRIYLR